jgi:hypothetical protein
MTRPLNGIGDPRLWCGPSRPAPVERPLRPRFPTLCEEVVQEFLDARPFRTWSRSLSEEIAELFDEARELGERRYDLRDGDQHRAVAVRSPDQLERIAQMWHGPAGEERMARMLATRSRNPEWLRNLRALLDRRNSDQSWRSEACRKRSLNPEWHRRKAAAAKRRSIAGSQPQFRQKLSDQQVLEIRQARASGEKLQRLAVQYGVAVSTISMLSRGERRAGVAP